MATKEAMGYEQFEGVVAALKLDDENKVSATRILLSMLVQFKLAHHSDEWNVDGFVDNLQPETIEKITTILSENSLEEARALGEARKVAETVREYIVESQNGAEHA